MTATSLQFANWSSLNRAGRLKGPNEICDDVQRNTYLLGEIIQAQGAKQSVRAGSYIEERVRVNRQGNFASYDPGESRQPGRIRSLQTIRWGWRFFENPFTWTDADLDLSQGDELTVFKNFKKSMDDELEIEHYEGMEDLLFKRPNSATMEPIDNRKGDAYSIPVYCAENTSTYLPPASVWTSSDVAGLDPDEVDTWRPSVSTYSAGNLSSPTSGLFRAFREIWQKLDYQAPAGHKVYMENGNLRALKICTNTNGRVEYETLCSTGNDQFRAGPQDPAYGSPVYHGVPVLKIKALDTELLDETGGAYTGTVYPDGRPRFFCLNLKHMKVVFHPKHFMRTTDPVGGSIQQRDAFAVFKVSWLNITCTSRRRQGVICPAA